MKVVYVSLEEVLRIHFQVIRDFGGTHGVRDEGRLKSAVEAPKQVVFGEEQYPGIVRKASVYLRNIIGDHPFTDGNKRSALTVAAIFLMRNGYHITALPSELEEFVVGVATHKATVDEITSWLEHNTAMT